MKRAKLEKLAIIRAQAEDWTEKEILAYIRAASTEELESYVR